MEVFVEAVLKGRLEGDARKSISGAVRGAQGGRYKGEKVKKEKFSYFGK